MMLNVESINLRINKFIRCHFSNMRKKKIKNTNFTIISNNCWGGMIYESYALKKQTPTVGLFFSSKDYIKFISNLNYYLSQELKFIEYDESKNIMLLEKCNINKNVPIGILDDIEIIFLHYKNQEIAMQKWNKRISRINYSNIIFKFNDQNDCNEEDVKKFLKLPYKNKIFFTVKDWNIKDDNIIKIPQAFNKECIYASHEPFGNNIFFNVNRYINNIKCERYFNKD